MAQRQTDEELYGKSCDGDNEALKELLSRYDETLMLFLYAIVGNYEDAEELELDAFAAAVSKTSRFHGYSSFKTWLFAIARKLALKSMRRHSLLLYRDAEQAVSAGKNNPDDSEVPQPELRLLRIEQRREIFDAMEELNTEYRESLYLTYFEDMKLEEVALAMGRTKRQISDLLYRGRQSLKIVLERRGIHDAEL